jgi:3-hydroxyacyl-CoA dehydrogenase/enoyl-CoA hydratase/3-hydroxybutyryl-CoA epimerase
MTDIIGMHWAEDADGIVTLTMDDPTSEANIMNEVFEQALTQTVAKLKAKKRVLKGLLLPLLKKLSLQVVI